MIKISVIESQGKVIARLEGCENDAYNVLTKLGMGDVVFDKETVKMPTYIKAVAKCHPEDKFDVEVGTELARKRVIEKYNKHMSRILADVGNSVDAFLERLDEKLEVFDN